MGEETYDETKEPEIDDYPEEQQNGDPMDDRHNVVAEIFNTRRRIEMLRRRWRGDVLIGNEWFHDESKELASDKFINKQLSQMESIITETNSFSRKTDIETKRILKDSVDAFIEDAVNDDSVENCDIRTMCKGYEHSLELFLGLVEFGHGANVFKDAMAGLNSGDVERKGENKTVGQWLDKRF
jgi:hypothetical protein